MTDTLAQRLERYARDEGLFPAPGLALLAVSGGTDSVALLDLMVNRAAEPALELAVVHVNHGTGQAADVAEAAVRRMAEERGIPIHVARLELPADWSETAAREQRYRELQRIRNELGAAYLVMGHNSDDQAETVLLRFLKGSGPSGLAGMSPATRGLVRPLLPFSRAELEGWLAERQLANLVVQDPSNADTRHDRNWLRHELLPLVRSRFPAGPGDGLLRTARLAAEERLAWSRLLRIPELEFRSGEGWAEVARGPLQRYDELLCEALLRGVARELGVVLGRRQSALVRRFVADGTSGHSLDIGDGWRVELAFEHLRFVGPEGTTLAPESLTVDWAQAGASVRWGGWRFDAEPAQSGQPERESFVTWLEPGAVTIRGLRKGDRIRPLGGTGARPVRRLLMEAKIPAPMRWRYPIIESRGEILWVPGICRADTAVPETGTKAIRVDANEA